MWNDVSVRVFVVCCAEQSDLPTLLAEECAAIVSLTGQVAELEGRRAKPWSRTSTASSRASPIGALTSIPPLPVLPPRQPCGGIVRPSTRVWWSRPWWSAGCPPRCHHRGVGLRHLQPRAPHRHRGIRAGAAVGGVPRVCPGGSSWRRSAVCPRPPQSAVAPEVCNASSNDTAKRWRAVPPTCIAGDRRCSA